MSVYREPTYQELERKVAELEHALTANDEEMQKVCAENAALKEENKELKEHIEWSNVEMRYSAWRNDIGIFHSPEQTGGVTIKEQLACVAREIAIRKHVYPKRIKERGMTPERAASEMATMQAVFETFKGLQEGLADDEIP